MYVLITFVSPWYDLRGWLGRVKQQLSIYLSVSTTRSMCPSTARCVRLDVSARPDVSTTRPGDVSVRNQDFWLFFSCANLYRVYSKCSCLVLTVLQRDKREGETREKTTALHSGTGPLLLSDDPRGIILVAFTGRTLAPIVIGVRMQTNSTENGCVLIVILRLSWGMCKYVILIFRAMFWWCCVIVIE